MNKRVQRKGDAIVGQIKVLWWWITVKRFNTLPDAFIWLGYGEKD